MTRTVKRVLDAPPLRPQIPYMTDLHKEKTYFFKATRAAHGKDSLSTIRIAANKLQGIHTTLVLDTNVLIRMEKVVKAGNKASAVKAFGLHSLVEIGLRAPAQCLHLSPGLALSEMPPGLAEQSRLAFECFLARHLPNFVDSPDSLQSQFAGKTADYGYFDLEHAAQCVLAIPFSSLVHLQLVDALPKLKPLDKFERFLNVLEREVDLLSFKEVEIARYCFAVPPPEARRLIDIRRLFRRNFLQTAKGKLPRDTGELLQVAFNGACDLHLLNSANVMDDDLIDGVRQDCWIATCDKKLAQFSELTHYTNIDGSSGKFIGSAQLPEQWSDDYWMQSDAMFAARRLSRQARFAAQELNFEELPLRSERARVLAREHFESPGNEADSL